MRENTNILRLCLFFLVFSPPFLHLLNNMFLEIDPHHLQHQLFPVGPFSELPVLVNITSLLSKTPRPKARESSLTPTHGSPHTLSGSKSLHFQNHKDRKDIFNLSNTQWKLYIYPKMTWISLFWLELFYSNMVTLSEDY